MKTAHASLRDQFERVATVALAAAFCYVAVAVQPHHLLHTYHAANTGVVAWDCGPGLEVLPSVALFIESEC